MLHSKGRLVRVVVTLALMMMGAGASAYQVAPMIYDMTVSGRGATAVLRVQNDSARPITVEVVAEKRAFDEKGQESRTPADDDFILFPPQAVIAAGATQAIRVQYIGSPNLDKSAMYTVTVKQVPVALPATGPSGVQFVFNFSTLANIVPQNAKASVEASALTSDGDHYVLRLHNSGNKYANLALSKVTLSAGGQSTVIDGDAWRKLLGTSWILPGNDRAINIPRASLAAAGAASAAAETPTVKFELVEPTR